MSSTTPTTEPVQAGETEEQQQLRPQHDPLTTVFVGNVAHETTEEELEAVFRDAFPGVEVEIPVKEHQETINAEGETKPAPASKHAFVKFPQEIDVDEIKEKFDKTELHEREIHIKRIRTSNGRFRGANRRGGAGFRGRGGFRGGARGGRGGAFRGSARGGRGAFRGGARGGRNDNRRNKKPLSEMERSTDTLYVNNVPYDTTKAELAEFFGVSEDNLSLPMRRMRDETTREVFLSDKLNRGMAFVTFQESVDIASKASEYNGQPFRERNLVVDVAVVKEENEPEQQEQGEEQEPATEKTNE